MSPGGGFIRRASRHRIRPKYWPEYMCSNTIRPDVFANSFIVFRYVGKYHWIDSLFFALGVRKTPRRPSKQETKVCSPEKQRDRVE